MQYFVMMCNVVDKLHMEKLLISVAINLYYIKKLQVLLFERVYVELDNGELGINI